MCIRILFLFTLLLSTSAVQSQEYLRMIDAGTYSVDEIRNSAEAYFKDMDKGRGSGYVQYKRWEYNAMRLVNEEGYVPSLIENLNEWDRYNAYLNENSENAQNLNDNWVDLGPTSWNATSGWNPGVGRITGIAVDKINNNHILVGSETGGVWRSPFGGTSWSPISENFSNLFVYSVAIHPQNSDILYFGSTNGLIFKSLDIGITWNLLGIAGNSRINKILIHPTNAAIMFATSENSGIYKSTDGGATWQIAVADTNGYDVEFSPGNPNIVFATGLGVHKSVDGGASFTTLGGFSSGPKMLGMASVNTNIVYVLEAAAGIFGGFYVSTDMGASFTLLNHGGLNFFGYSTSGTDGLGQAPRDMDIAVNPTNDLEVHIAGILTWRSLDGGVNFTCTSDWIPANAAGANIGYCHADVDILVFDGTDLFAGTDGGIFKAANTLVLDANYYTDLSTGLGIRQFYKIGISQTSGVVVSGGSQDNGTSTYKPVQGWRDWLGADGMESFVDKDNFTTLYGTSQFGAIYRTDDDANTYIDLPEPGPGSGEWVTPFEQDPSVTNTIYLGYNSVYKSADKGATWSSISQVFGGNLDHLKIAPSNNQIMYAANGNILYKTTDGGTTSWSTITSPGGSINSIAIHPTNPNKIAVASTSVDAVYVSNDGGTTWLNYKKNLPNFSALAVVWDDNGEDALYVGMNYGVYYIDNNITNWLPYSNNLPNVIINELEVNNTEDMLYAGTYGRGLWSSPLEDGNLGIGNSNATDSVKLFPNPTSSALTITVLEPMEATISVYDLLGKLCIEEKNVLLSNSHSLSVSSLTSGVYFIRINSEKARVTKKFIKE